MQSKRIRVFLRLKAKEIFIGIGVVVLLLGFVLFPIMMFVEWAKSGFRSMVWFGYMIVGVGILETFIIGVIAIAGLYDIGREWIIDNWEKAGNMTEEK